MKYYRNSPRGLFLFYCKFRKKKFKTIYGLNKILSTSNLNRPNM